MASASPYALRPEFTGPAYLLSNQEARRRTLHVPLPVCTIVSTVLTSTSATNRLHSTVSVNMELPNDVLRGDGFAVWIAVDGSPCAHYGMEYEEADAVAGHFLPTSKRRKTITITEPRYICSVK